MIIFFIFDIKKIVYISKKFVDIFVPTPVPKLKSLFVKLIFAKKKTDIKG